MASSFKELVTSKKKLENNYLTSNKLTSFDIQFRALTIAEGLTCLDEPNNMTAWYCKAYKTLGEGKYAALASMARKGNTPQRLFGWLLKNEMGNAK